MFESEVYRAGMRKRLRKNGYGFVSSWTKVNMFTVGEEKLKVAVNRAAKLVGAQPPRMPVVEFGNGELLKQFFKMVEDFLATPLGQALEQILIKLLLGLIVV